MNFKSCKSPLHAEGFTYMLSLCYSPLVIQATITECSSGQGLDWEAERMQKESAEDLGIKEEERVIDNSKAVTKVQLRYGRKVTKAPKFSLYVTMWNPYV